MSSQNSPMNELKLKFGTESNEIDADTLINSIFHFSAVVQAVNKGLSPERKLDVKVKAFEPGSFVVNLVLDSTLIETAIGFFTKDNISYVAELAGAIGGVYSLAKWLRGKKPKELTESGDNISITDGDNNNITINKNIYNIYNNQAVQVAIAKEFETLNEDDDVKTFEIIDNVNGQTVDFSSADIEELSDIDVSSADKTRQVIKNDASLIIVSLSFDKKKKWEFIYEGIKISAKIKDDVFHKTIDKGERFAKGDVLKAHLEISQHLLPHIGEYTNSSYVVTSIEEHIKRPVQNSFFDDIES